MTIITTINPANEKKIFEYHTTTVAEVQKITRDAHQAQKDWARLSLGDRLACFHKFIAILEQEKERLASIITEEVGKPLRESIAEVERCKMPLAYYCEHGERLLRDEIVQTHAQRSYIRFEPIGVVAVFTPWNYPIWGIFRQLAPALLCGNGLIVKPSSKTVGSTLPILELAKQAGLPDGLISVVLGNMEIVEPLIAGIETVVVITSPQQATKIAEVAGHDLKRINLQLSGSDVLIVLEDVDIDKTVQKAVTSRLRNAGQDCVAAKRFIVHAEVYEAFVDGMVKTMNKIKVGDPTRPDTGMGPLGHEKLLDILEAQVQDASQKGAKVLLGGKRLDRRGYFFPPTVIADVKPNMKVWQEETFGPVSAVMRAETDEEAIKMANNSPFGLGASIWTKNVRRGESLAERLEVGVVAINGQPGSHPAIPFGGVKQTGMGRDFAKYGLLHFLNTKSVLTFSHNK
jgi:acyl-CoA reductase-like NAD-dependent aldehyde dehydrogenase